MHPNYEKADRLTHEVIAAAFEVHRHFGPGLLESIYEWALGVELEQRGIHFVCQKLVRVEYKGAVREYDLRCDILVEDCLLIDNKAVTETIPRHKAQTMSYMKLLDTPLGLILNYHMPKMIDGVTRLMLPGANQ